MRIHQIKEASDHAHHCGLPEGQEHSRPGADGAEREWSDQAGESAGLSFFCTTPSVLHVSHLYTVLVQHCGDSMEPTISYSISGIT